jgi:hypothetical protein
MVPAIRQDMQALDKGAMMPTPSQLLQATPTPKPAPTVTFSPIPGRHHPITRAQLISQTALNTFVTKEALYKHQAFIPARFTAPVCVDGVPNYAQFASPMVHPVTGETISSYKQLMPHPAMAEVWKTAFGNDFGGMVQGNIKKTSQKGTNLMFVMNHNKIRKVYVGKQKFTLPKLSWTIAPKKKIHILSTLWLGVTSFNTKVTYHHAQQILPCHSSCGTVSSALGTQSKCALTSKNLSCRRAG